MKKRWIYGIIIFLSFTTIGLAIDWWSALPEGEQATYVGRQTCFQCHQKEAAEWKGSDHDLAMNPATPEFVLGDFDNTELEHFGITSSMTREGDKYYVTTQGPDGKRTRFEVKYVIGVRPLQQYLAELARGRIQVLPVTWDTEMKRWYYVSPDEPFGPDDPLHWTGSAQNWNHMCAECHTTNWAKNYDVASDAHNFSFSEMRVSCEACHGPGSIHVELANSHSLFWDRRYGYGLAKLKGKDATAQLESCAPCHSHRRHVSPGHTPLDRFHDHYALSLLDDHLYHPDGQIDEEVYVFGSFTQSKMYRKGVRCTDCHNPHSLKLKFEGNKLCTQCHLEAKYDVPSHHFHKMGTKGAACVECHMPSKTYMGVDPRRDHSLRIPRPDLTVKLGTPNACNQCHTKPEENSEWAAQKVEEWYGPKRRDDPHYGEILAAGRAGKRDAEQSLIKLTREKEVGPIVRATAVSLLATRYNTPESREVVERALKSKEELVRRAALQGFEGWAPSSEQEASRIGKLLAEGLTDSSRGVRTEVARILAGLPIMPDTSQNKKALTKALDEYKAGLLADSDQSGSHMSLGMLYAQQGDLKKAEAELRTAIKLAPSAAGPRSNLAQLLEQQGRDEEVKQLRTKEAELLARDAKLLPENAMLQYRLGLLYYLLGREDEAVTALKKACELEPQSADFRLMLTLLYEKQQKWKLAWESAAALVRLQPNNQQFRQIYLNMHQKANPESN
ncbi:tetratricopeptide repeat protein [Gimesia sp.]|uniref:tetratricopeptide repeat protein n=1 Tax=Gimesia sp. TaxID=2024833 RepID=UPI000C6C1FDF|nr:tetratricopeptide repeat protein [Gimesia sp.]MAX39647.1 hypothetical protein [Gimesia sp.]HBL46827.1 hypothetical protein [Planctomycetaceae bacterium]|tara:strand:+ start:10065 stop:12251 length:2187 start_codon:yes stop_codon:yes gene_type:complete